MADKEVTLYLVDVGISMAERRHGRQETDLDWAMRYVWDRITSTVRSSEGNECDHHPKSTDAK